MNEINAIADNGGGITLQITSDAEEKYQHTYYDIEQCAGDLLQAIGGANAYHDWDGNEVAEDDAAWLIASYEDIRNGGFAEILGVKSVDDLAAWSKSSWHNCAELAAIVVAKSQAAA